MNFLKQQKSNDCVENYNGLMETHSAACGTVSKAAEIQSKENFINSGQSESELIRKIRNGEKEQFRHLVDLYKDLVFRLIRKQVGSDTVAEDIAQEVFVRAYFSIGKFRAESGFSTWISRIALNQTSSYFSSKKYRNEKLNESFDSNLHEISDENCDSSREHELQQLNRMRIFRQALAMLKPAFREVLVLCALEEKSYEEVSRILEIPTGTVKSRLNKARLLIAYAIKEIEG